MTDQPRQPQGVPGGGRFASKAHAEVTIDLTDPDAVPLPVLRRAAMQAVGTAIEELESRNMESLRHSYQAFPTASYGAALESLRRMRSEMCGDPPPQYRTGTDVAFDEFRNRTTFIPGRRPITEIQTEAIEQIDRAVESLDHKAVAQCRDADRSFPGDAYAKALANLRAIRDQIHVGSPPKISSDVAKAWSGLTIKGPQMGVYQRRLDAAVAQREIARGTRPDRTSPARPTFRGPQMGVYQERLMAALAQRETDRKASLAAGRHNGDGRLSGT